MDELIKALGHINFYLADADEIFAGRKANAFDNERIRIFIEVEMLKDIRISTIHVCSTSHLGSDCRSICDSLLLLL